MIRRKKDTQDKKRCVRPLMVRVKMRRRILMIGKALIGKALMGEVRRREGLNSPKLLRSSVFCLKVSCSFGISLLNDSLFEELIPYS